MSVFKRMSDVLQQKLNAVLDRTEDPNEALDFAYQKQLESLQQVRRNVADVLTAEKRLELQEAQLKQSTEKRLRHLYSLGVGGHINRADVADETADPVEEGLRREFEEEVTYEGAWVHRLIGLINDDSNDVSRVHLALVFEVSGERPEIGIRETGKLEGELLKLEEMKMYYLDMESWSQLIYDHLLAREVAQRDGGEAVAAVHVGRGEGHG